MNNVSKQQIIENVIKAEVSKLIPDNGESSFLRQIIFGFKTKIDWSEIPELIIYHFPEQEDNIKRILDFNLSKEELENYSYEPMKS